MTGQPQARSRLTVGVPRYLLEADPASGAGKMWQRVLHGLGERGVRLTTASSRLRRALGSRPDVWLTNGHDGAVDVGVPVVAHLHEAPWRETDANHFLNPEFAEASLRQSDAAAAQASRIITPSEFSRRQIITTHGVDAGHVHAVHHGVDPRTFNPARKDEGERLVRARGGSAPYVAFVSVAHPRKNLAALRDAMVAIADRGLPHSLVTVLSPAADRGDFDTLFAELTAELPGHPGRVLSLTRLTEDEVAGVIAGADALCAPSWSEGFGFAALEAMASATPVVVSNRGALPEVVGDAGVVVEPDADAIAAALMSILGDPQRAAALGAAGLERAKGFGWDVTAAGWLAVLEQAA